MAEQNKQKLEPLSKEDKEGEEFEDEFDILRELCDDCGFPNCVLLHATDLRGIPFDPAPQRSSLFKYLKSTGEIMFAEGEDPNDIVTCLKKSASNFCFGFSGGVYGGRKDHSGTGAFLPPPSCVIDHIERNFSPKNKQNNYVVDEIATCEYCNSDKCVLLSDQDFEGSHFVPSFKNHLTLMAENNRETGVSNRTGRFLLYKDSSRFFFGYLGAGNRKKLPSCAEGYIRSLFPSDKGYTGFKESAQSLEK